jgi:hypothetical protein
MVSVVAQVTMGCAAAREVSAAIPNTILIVILIVSLLAQLDSLISIKVVNEFRKIHPGYIDLLPVDIDYLSSR